MGMTRDELFDELDKSTGKSGGRNPRLSLGTYLLMITDARLIADEFTRDKPPEEQVLQGALVKFKVLEATPGAENPVGTKADWYKRLNAAKKWARDNDKAELRAFVDATTGEEGHDYGELFDEGELRGLVVRCQVVPGKKEGWPDFHWTHVEQSAANVERRREELEE